MTFPASIALLANLVQDSDGAHTETITIPATSPYTHQLGQGSPLNYPSGWQIVPPTGITGVVTIGGGGHATWTEVTLGMSLAAGQFSVDYSTSPTGGMIYFSSADAGLTNVTITYTGATLVNEAVLQSFVTALRDISSATGAANGLPTLDANARVAQPPAHGIIQAQATQLASDINFDSNHQGDPTQLSSWADWGANTGVTWDIATVTLTEGKVLFRISCAGSSAQVNNDWLRVGVRWSGASSGFINLGYFVPQIGTNEDGGIFFCFEGYAQLGAGAYTFTPIYEAGGPTSETAFSCNPTSRPTQDRACFSLLEFI